MTWSIIKFGKYEKNNITLPQLIFKDLDYFFWCIEKSAFDNKGSLTKEANYIFNHCSKIKPPKNYYVKHFLNYKNNSFGFSFIEKDDAILKYQDNFDCFAKDSILLESDPFTILKYIHLYFPRQQQGYDKNGNKYFIRQVKEYIFERKNATKQRVESFFSNQSNFYSE